MDIFRIYMEGLLKNVQDGISRPLDSRETQKTKVLTVLPDTLQLELNISLAQL